MVTDMTELTLDVVGAALFGRGLGCVAKKIGSAVTTGLRLGEIAARITIVAAPPAWSVRAFGEIVHHAPLLPWPLDQAQLTVKPTDGRGHPAAAVDQRLLPRGAALLLTSVGDPPHGDPGR
jgi:hypothetical protein